MRRKKRKSFGNFNNLIQQTGTTCIKSMYICTCASNDMKRYETSVRQKRNTIINLLLAKLLAAETNNNGALSKKYSKFYFYFFIKFI